MEELLQCRDLTFTPGFEGIEIADAGTAPMEMNSEIDPNPVVTIGIESCSARAFRRARRSNT